jgi:hypothetical protein
VDTLEDTTTAYALSGSRLQSIPDGLKRQIVWSGAASERPLVRDEDGNWRYLSMYSPGRPALTAITATPTPLRPNVSYETPTTCSEGTVTANFSNAGNARDNDTGTYASKTISSTGIVCTGWQFDTSVLTADHVLNILLATSSMPIGDPWDIDWPSETPSGSPSEAVDARLVVDVSTDDGTTFNTIFTATVPVSAQQVQTTLKANQDMANVIVRVILNYRSGTVQVAPAVYEIWAQASDSGSASYIAAGTYWYTIVEAFTQTMSDQKSYTVLSEPSDLDSIVIPADTNYGVVINAGEFSNTPAMGVRGDTTNGRWHGYWVYRSTTTGSYPDLGKIATINAEDYILELDGAILTLDGETLYLGSPSYTDDFTVSGTTLASPPLPVVYLEDAVFPLASAAPAFLDATLFDGSVVGIPYDDPYSIAWSPPGYPEYFPLPQQFSFAVRNIVDPCAGVTNIGGRLIVFLRTAVLRVENLPMVTTGDFRVEELDTDLLSPSEGLAGTPLAYCHFHSQKGHAVVAWVSDSGIWMTDGTLLSERGLGLVKLTSHQDWRGDVDTSRLDETSLRFDPVLQTVYFDYYDTGGTLRTETIHIAPHHWVQSGEDQMVPKFCGPHSLSAVTRVIGENGGVVRHWSLSTADLKIYSERVGTQDDGSDILSHAETEWNYPAGPRNEVHIYQGSLEHSDWGASEVADVEIVVRDDRSGIEQRVPQRSVPLRGDRLSGLDWINRAGRSVRAVVRHKGKTVSNGTGQRAIGPLVLVGEAVGEDLDD